MTPAKLPAQGPAQDLWVPHGRSLQREIGLHPPLLATGPGQDWLWPNSSFPGICEILTSFCWHLGPHETGTWRVRVVQGLGGLSPTPSHQGPSEPPGLLPPMGSVCGGISCDVHSSHLVGGAGHYTHVTDEETLGKPLAWVTQQVCTVTIHSRSV